MNKNFNMSLKLYLICFCFILFFNGFKILYLIYKKLVLKVLLFIYLFDFRYVFTGETEYENLEFRMWVVFEWFIFFGVFGLFREGSL